MPSSFLGLDDLFLVQNTDNGYIYNKIIIRSYNTFVNRCGLGYTCRIKSWLVYTVQLSYRRDASLVGSSVGSSVGRALGMLPGAQWFNPTTALSLRKKFLNYFSVNTEAGQISTCTLVKSWSYSPTSTVYKSIITPYYYVYVTLSIFIGILTQEQVI